MSMSYSSITGGLPTEADRWTAAVLPILHSWPVDPEGWCPELTALWGKLGMQNFLEEPYLAEMEDWQGHIQLC